jgi:hypothetical protein
VGDAPAAPPATPLGEPQRPTTPAFDIMAALAGAGALAVIMLLAYWAAARRRANTMIAPASALPLTLPDADRAVVLENLRLWLEAPTPMRAAEQVK